MIEGVLDALADLIARVGGAGARAAGDPADEGVDTAGDAMFGRSAEAEGGNEIYYQPCAAQLLAACDQALKTAGIGFLDGLETAVRVLMFKRGRGRGYQSI
jgi:hypothetical protein